MGLKFNPLIFSGLDFSGDSTGSAPTIGGPITGGTDGSVLFVHPTGVLAQDNANFNFNDTTFELTITGNLSAATFNNYTPENSANKGQPNGYAPLDGSAKVPYANLPSALMTYKGAWNPTTNTPTLANGVGLIGDTYRASVDGASTAPIVDNWFAGDFIIYNGTIWQRSPLADGVVSVNGQSGIVILTRGNLTDSTAGADGISVTGGTNAVWGSGTSIAQLQSSAVQSGFLSSTDWNTFNNKQPAGNYANTNLSNLASPTAVNQHLIAGLGNTFDLGSLATYWNKLFVNEWRDSANIVIIDTARRLYNTAGSIVVDFAGVSSVLVGKDFLPSAAGTYKLGTSLAQWTEVNSEQFTNVHGGILTSRFDSHTGPTPAGISVDSSLFTFSNKPFGLYSGSNAAGTGIISIETGNASGGNSGNINIQTGTASGTRGSISLNGSLINANTTQIKNVVDPTLAQDAATKNYVDTSISSGSFANNSLSNLVATSINQSLVPNADLTLEVGSTTRHYSNVYAGALKSNTGPLLIQGSPINIGCTGVFAITASAVDVNVSQIHNVVDPTNAQDAATKNYVDNAISGGGFANQALSNLTTTSINQSLLPSSSLSKDIGSSTLLWKDLYTQTLKDTTGTVSVQALVRNLINSAGTIVLDWSSTFLDVNTHKISNVVDPTTAQDAATKAYVDAAFSTGDIRQTSFSAAASQTNQPVTGFAFANASVRSFSALVSVSTSATLYAQFNVYGIQKGASWELSQDSLGDSTGYTFSINSSGQVLYTSGATTATIKFRAIVTNV